MEKLKESLDVLPKINAAICVQLTTLTGRMDAIKSQPTKDGDASNAVCTNMSQFLEGIADDLYKMAKTLKNKPDAAKQEKPSPLNELLDAVDSAIVDKSIGNPENPVDDNKRCSSNGENDIHDKLPSSQESSRFSVQRLNEEAKEKLFADSSSSHDSDATMLSLPEIDRRPKKKLKKRKLKKNFTADDSTDYTSSSDSSSGEKKAKTQSQVSIISQKIDDLCKDNSEAVDAVPTVNNSLNAADEFIREENSNEVEIGVKTELQSQAASSQCESQPASSQCESQAQSAEDGATEPEKMDNSLLQGNDMDGLSDSDSFDGDAAEMNSSDEEEEDDDEIRKLLDFASLGVRRKPTRAADLYEDYDDVGAAADDIQPSINHVQKKPAKPKEDELMKILEADLSNDSEEEIENSDTDEIITEEQYLVERNDMMKKQLLMDSSSESIVSDDEFDEMRPSNGHSNDMSHSDSNIDDDHGSDISSNGSLMESFLKFSEKIGKKDKNSKSEEEAAAAAAVASSPSSSSHSNETENHSESASANSKEIILKSGSGKRKYDDDDDSELDLSDSNSGKVVAKKSKTSTIGQNIGAALEKDYELIVPSDDEDDVTSDANKAKTPDGNKKNGDKNGPLDTTMFKKVTKEVDTIDLSKKLQSDRSKQLASTSRSTPDDVVSLSSDDDTDVEIQPTEKVGDKESPEDDKRKQRKLLREDQLTDDTKTAQKAESERIKRLEAKKKQLSQFIDSQMDESQDSEVVDNTEVLLDYDSKRKEKIVIHPEIRKLLKDHQVDGIKFMYDCCYGSVDNIEKDTGSGCILAHCMGLGKTLQMITLLHTVISYPQLKSDRILVICPKSTVMNWKDEIERWLKPIQNSRPLKLFQFPEAS